MHRALYTSRGPLPQDVIECVDFTAPDLTAGDVLIEMLAAPINPSDVLTLTGEYGMLPPLPAVGGNEGVGRIAAVGDGVSLPVGLRVMMPVGAGTWTSHLVARADALVPLPSAGDSLQMSMVNWHLDFLRDLTEICLTLRADSEGDARYLGLTLDAKALFHSDDRE